MSPLQQSHLPFDFSQQSCDPLQHIGCFGLVKPSGPMVISTDPALVKKLNHNASERNRRRRINGLYSGLRSLLPSSNQTDKLSIATTVTRVLQYIPELQQEIQKLAKEKEELLLQMDFNHEGEDQSSPRGGIIGGWPRANGCSLEGVADGSVYAGQLSEREMAVQICTPRQNTGSPLSEILLNLEMDGFSLINVSTLQSLGDGDSRVFYNLHVQAEKRSNSLDCDGLRKKIWSLCLNNT
ncbi:hypothetical protein SAY87_032163 [Trapa incisa]|uniref:BHLH domain-containing protein n=1 Tax=Trapa incisa TaxID=236973 RepID=A0AAN7QMK3_9MYRT|nr:hypothetical protein SAY87_032163 [Trapa incisa]